MASPAWPSPARDRDRVVLALRGERPSPDPWQYQSAFVEEERSASGAVVRVATLLLTGRECRWRCAMCDLWRFTTPGDTPAGAIPFQVGAALAMLRTSGASASQVKLYNASSFFDPGAVPESDDDAVARLVAGFDRVIVESHPSLVGPRAARFAEMLSRDGQARLEVAMGLETAHPTALERLHKRITVDTFDRAAQRLRALGLDLRVFLLVHPPFVPAAEQDEWLVRSIKTAVAAGATAVSLVPTRRGNGAMELLEEHGLFTRPRLSDVERGAGRALGAASGRARVFVDLWQLERTSACAACFEARRRRLHQMNLSQEVAGAVSCPRCGGTAGG